MKNLDLRDAKIWISGSVPERDYWPDELYDRELLSFLKLLSSLAMQAGATLLHGSHPSFTPVITEAHKEVRASASQLHLFVSDFFENTIKNKYSEQCLVTETERFSNESKSLYVMRELLAQQSNIMIVLGGKLHKGMNKLPGVIEEAKIAITRNTKVIVLPHFKGASELLPSGHNTVIIKKDSELNILAHQIVRDIESYLAIKSKRSFSTRFKSAIERLSRLFK